MDFPFPFVHPMFPSMTAGPMPFFGMTGIPPGPAFGIMPTIEEREEFSLAILNDQKKQIVQMKQYFQECLKSLDASIEVIDKEISKINAARSQRQPGAASETRSKREREKE